MNMINLKEALMATLRDRSFLIIWFILIVLALLVVVMGLVNIRPTDLQVPTRYTAYGITNFYRDKWYYAIAFILFVLSIGALNVLASLRLYAVKGREMALAYLWLSVIIMVISAATVFAILKLTSFGQ